MTAAQLNYVDALRATAINGSPGGPDIYELESALMRTFYIQAQTPKLFFGSDVTPYKVRKMLDEVGSSSYERRVKYSTPVAEAGDRRSRAISSSSAIGTCCSTRTKPARQPTARRATC